MSIFSLDSSLNLTMYTYNYMFITLLFRFIGSKRVFSLSFTRGNCSVNRYQPMIFRTNERMSECVFAKSICNEEGQILYQADSSKKDRTCRCDYAKNYAFIKIPRHFCYCIPSEEDCSCYIRSCPINHTLSTGN